MAADTTVHIAMYPWLALGHLTPFLHFANKLAKKGHKISFFIPAKTQHKVEHFNLHPNLIKFVPITIPHVDGLPPGAETTADVPFPLYRLIMTAMDRTESEIDHLLQELKPDVVFFDFTHWMPRLTRRLGIKSVMYYIVSTVTLGYVSRRKRVTDNTTDYTQPPLGFPSSSIKLSISEARSFERVGVMEFGSGISFGDRLHTSLIECDAIAYRTCREIEGPFIDYVVSQYGKPVLLSGPVIPEAPPASLLDKKWDEWLRGFERNSVIYCALGSESNIQKEQFQELVMGLELTRMPFFAALKPPPGVESLESALPEGFEERVKGRGVIHGGWVQQQLILQHPSIGCFVTHCGSDSLSEALINECQLVLLPQSPEHMISARMMGKVLKVGVQVDKGEEDGLFTKEGVCKAVKTVMEEGSEIAEEVRINHAKLREILADKALESSYIDDFNENLLSLLK